LLGEGRISNRQCHIFGPIPEGAPGALVLPIGIAGQRPEIADDGRSRISNVNKDGGRVWNVMLLTCSCVSADYPPGRGLVVAGRNNLP
jgi:hypothetical protein